MSDPWAEFVTEAPKKLSQAADIGMSGLSGLVQGGAQFLGTPGDVVQLVQSGATKGVAAAEKRGFAPKGMSAIMGEALKGGPPGGMKMIGDANRAGLAAALRAGGASQEQASGASRVVGGGLPTTKDIEATLGSPKYHKPQTTAGEYSRTIGQFAPAALLPGSLATRAANAVVPALTSETAGQITKGSDVEPYARVAGALLGGAGVAALTRPRPTTRMLASGSRGATDDQIQLAQVLREEARARGVTLTQAEAVQQVSGNATGLGRMQRVLEGTPAGSERLLPVMSRRPEEVRNAVTQFADNIAPPAADPYVLGSQAQEAAGGVMNGVRQEINANARPFYEALAGERMPTAAPAYQELLQNPAYQEALGQVRGNPILNAQVGTLPDDSLAVVNEVVKQLGTMADNARPNPASATGNAQMAAAYDAARGSADELASAVSEPWRLSRAMVSSGREAFLEPLQAGPMGAISKTPDVQAQTRALFPSAPPEGAAGATGQAVSMLPPEAGGGLVRQHVMNSMNEATQNLQSGPNQWGGAKLAATIAGNPEQGATLRAGIEAAAPGQADEFDRLTRILEATGKRQAPGSQTAYNTEELRRLGEAGAVGEGVKAIASGPSMFRRFGEGLQDWQTQRNAGQLADALLADPARATEILLEARRTVPPGAALENIERLAITATQGRQGENLPVVRPRP